MNRISVELRLAVPNLSDHEEDVTATFYWDRGGSGNLIATRKVRAAPRCFTLISVSCPMEGRTGKHRLLYRVERARGIATGAWPIEVVSSETPATPVLPGVWIEPLGALLTSRGVSDAETERNLRDSVDAMKRLGMNTLIIACVE